MIEHAGKDKVIRALLRVRAKEGKGGIVAVGEELEGALAAATLEWVDLVALAKEQRIRLLQRVLRKSKIKNQRS